MLKLNINRVFAIRGVTKVVNFLVDNGFTRSSAVHLYNFEASSVKIKNLEKVCRMLKCTPNDLFEWRPREGETPLDETHPLNTLRREKSNDIKRLMNDLPLEKLNDVEDFLKDLKSKL